MMLQNWIRLFEIPCKRIIKTVEAATQREVAANTNQAARTSESRLFMVQTLSIYTSGSPSRAGVS